MRTLSPGDRMTPRDSSDTDHGALTSCRVPPFHSKISGARTSSSLKDGIGPSPVSVVRFSSVIAISIGRPATYSSNPSTTTAGGRAVGAASLMAAPPHSTTAMHHIARTLPGPQRRVVLEVDAPHAVDVLAAEVRRFLAGHHVPHAVSGWSMSSYRYVWK